MNLFELVKQRMEVVSTLRNFYLIHRKIWTSYFGHSGLDYSEGLLQRQIFVCVFLSVYYCSIFHCFIFAYSCFIYSNFCFHFHHAIFNLGFYNQELMCTIKESFWFRVPEALPYPFHFYLCNTVCEHYMSSANRHYTPRNQIKDSCNTVNSGY